MFPATFWTVWCLMPFFMAWACLLLLTPMCVFLNAIITIYPWIKAGHCFGVGYDKKTCKSYKVVTSALIALLFRLFRVFFHRLRHGNTYHSYYICLPSWTLSALFMNQSRAFAPFANFSRAQVRLKICLFSRRVWAHLDFYYHRISTNMGEFDSMPPAFLYGI